MTEWVNESLCPLDCKEFEKGVSGSRTNVARYHQNIASSGLKVTDTCVTCKVTRSMKSKQHERASASERSGMESELDWQLTYGTVHNLWREKITEDIYTLGIAWQFTVTCVTQRTSCAAYVIPSTVKVKLYFQQTRRRRFCVSQIEKQLCLPPLKLQRVWTASPRHFAVPASPYHRVHMNVLENRYGEMLNIALISFSLYTVIDFFVCDFSDSLWKCKIAVVTKTPFPPAGC